MRGSHGWHGRTGVRGTIGGVLTALVLLVLAAPASAAPPICDNLTLDDVHVGDSVSGQIVCDDADGDSLSYTIGTPPAHGSAFPDGAGGLSYFAPFDYAGPDPFTVTVDDQQGGSDTVQVAVDVTNSVPACQPIDLGKKPHGSSTFLFASVDCSDPDEGDFAQAWEIVDQPTHGEATAQFGSLTYDPDDAYVGTDSFTYRVRDGVAWSEPATVTVELTNAAPECTDAPELMIRQDKPASAPVQCFDPDGDPLELVVIEEPAHGSISAEPGQFGGLEATYDPDDGYRGADDMVLAVTDGLAQSNTQDVELVITRNHAPQCSTWTTHTGIGASVGIDVKNACWDADWQDQDLVIALDGATSPQHGTLQGTGGVFTYTPTGTQAVADSFGFTASDGELLTFATMRVHIADTVFCSPDAPLRVRPGGTKTAGVSCTSPGFDFPTVSIVGQPSKGTVQLFGGLRYTASPTASGTDSFTFKAGTGELESPVATQQVIIDATANENPYCGVVDPARLTAYPTREATIYPYCSDPDGDVLTYTVSRAPAHGTTRREGQFIHYTAAAGYVGPDDLEITVTDGHGGTNTVTQALIVREPQAPGCAPVEDLTVRPGGTRTALLTCTNPQGDPQTYSIAEQPAKGTLAATGTVGEFRYTADAGATGADDFVLRATNAVGNTGVPVEVTIDESWNTSPRCSFFSSITVARGTTTDLPLAARCTDDQGDAITFTRSTAPQHGTATAGPAATLQYTADDTYTGSDFLGIVATDARGADSAEHFVSLNVVASLAPSCTPQPGITLRPGTTRSFPLQCTDPTFAPVTYEIVSGPTKGTLTPTGTSTSPSRSYTANAGASGADSFTYRATSTGGTSDPYTQSITIDPNANIAPSCFPNSFFPVEVVEGRLRMLFPACQDGDGDQLSYQPVTQPQHGSVTVANGQMTYTPAAGYLGPDEFTYTASDGRTTTTPTAMHLQVIEATAPVCDDPDPIAVRPQAPPRSVPVFCHDPADDPYEIVVDEEPEHGTVTLPGGFPYYVPDPGYEGPDSFSYHAVSVNGSSEPVTQEITVDSDANTDPECFAIPIKVKPGGTRQFTLPCFDADGDGLSWQVTEQPEHGSVTPTSGTGLLTYTADDTYVGPDPFDIAVDDDHGGTATGTVSINVSTVNSPPSCFGPYSITAQSGIATFLSEPCFDEDGDALTYEIVDEPDNGTVTEHPNGQRVYTSDPGYTGLDQFTFRAADGQASSQISTVNVNVTPAPGPSCVSQSYTVASDATLDVDLDCFGGADPVLAIADAPPAEAGTLGPIDQSGNTVRFTPDPDFRGDTSFTFVGSSGGQTSPPATIEITVIARGFAPNVFLTQGTWNPRTGVPVTFTATANDPDGGAIASYAWFVDGSSVAGATTSTLSRSFATAGLHTVRVRVVDDEGDASERTVSVLAHEGNQLPEVGIDVPSRVGTNVPVTLFAWAWDSDGPIAEYSWDFGDGSPVEEGATLDEVTHEFATAGTRTVKVTATDSDGATKTAQATIEVTDANTAPEVDLRGWPDPAQRGQPTWLLADASDAESDEIVAVDWDLDGDGSYETDGGTSVQRNHTFATAGDHTIGVRVEDGRGATATASRTIHVVNAPPQAKIAGPGVLDLGADGTYTDASTDDGAIASRAWDTDDDGVFDDGTGASVQVAAGSVTGYKTLRLRVTDNEGGTAIATRQITVRPAGPVVISDPVPPPLPGGGSVNIGTTTEPTSGATTITIPSGQVSQFPNRCMPLDVDVLIRKAAGATVLNPVLVLTTPGGGTERFPMTDANGDGTWTAHLDCTVAGTLTVEYTIKSADGSEQDFEIPAGKIVLIDPQGVVHDRAAYEAYRAAHPAASEDEARAATAIAGATVHLQRFVGGSWVDVNASDPGIDPNVNPQVTGANGLYKWDVSDGTYRVRVDAPGFRSKTSGPVVIPPPVLDLHVGLDRNPAPEAAIDAAADAFRGQTVTFTSDSSDDGSIAAQRWDLDDDGDFDDGTSTAVSGSFSSLGGKTVRLQVTDDEGAKTVAEHTITIANRAPTVSVGGPDGGVRGQELTFTATGDDADPDPDSLTYAWDTDGDGFDDGTGAAKAVTFATLGAKTVRARVTDADGGTATAERALTIFNQEPIADLGGPAEGFRGQSLTFTVTGADHDPGPDVLTFAWDTDNDGQFDDGTGASKSVAFDTLGTKVVRVQATDPDGGTATAQGTVTIVNRAPSATVGGPPTGFRGQDLIYTVTATDDDPGADTLTYAWDTDGDGFDDGTAASKTVSFDSLGDKPVKVRVTDPDGGTTTAERTVAIQNRTPTATVAGPATGLSGEDLTFTAAGEDPDPGPDSLTFEWDKDGDGFDDGTGASRTFQFDAPGAQTVRVRATDVDGGTGTPAQHALTILNRDPTAVVTGPATGFRAQDITFTATGTDPDPGADVLTFEWDKDGDGFDDGTGASRAFQFDSLGAQTVRVRSKDADGGVSAAAFHALTIVNRAPTASIAKAPAEPVDGDVVTFTATAADVDTGAAPALAWDLDGDGFDDGTGTTASRAFPAGTHTVRLQATDADGGSVTVPLAFTVKAKPTDPPPPPPPPPPGDTKAPSIAVALTKGQKLPAVLKSGLKLGLTTDEACTATVTVTVDKATARKLKLDPKAKKAVVVGTLTKALAAGKNAVTVKLTAKARKALKKAKSVKLGIAVTVKDAAGNTATKAAKLTLKTK